MLRAVAISASAGSTRRSYRCRRLGVHHQALAEDGVERLLGHPGHERAPDDVPHEKPVVEPRRDALLPEGAVEPPVGRMKRMSVVRAGDDEAGAGQPFAELIAAVDADMATLDVVVLTRERPADSLGPPARHCHRDPPAGADDAGDLRHRL